MTSVKPYFSVDDHLALLDSKKLSIASKDKAKKALGQISYYRFSGYAKLFMNTTEFISNTQIEHILDCILFDAELRSRILRLLEAVEIAFRAHIANYHAEKHGPLGYTNFLGFSKYDKYMEMLGYVYNIIDYPKNRFSEIKAHHDAKYSGKFPIWVIIQFFSFSQLSKTFSNLEVDLQKRISLDAYSRKYTFIENWLLILSELRNACAHCARLINCAFPSVPIIPKADRPKLELQLTPQGEVRHDRLIFCYLYVLKQMIINEDIWMDFLISLDSLIDKYPSVDISLYGFPKKWQEVLY
jgi:abortive infection bacteriophage resistance protein